MKAHNNNLDKARHPMNRYICIHSHFYQPPRENPWLEEVELQDSAYPYHDWNERITDECYAPNTASRILNPELEIEDIINNYSKMSFNFGPTLLSWLERREPEVYKSILKADEMSQQNFSGHGSAIAQVYNHMIMPLANEKDKETQVLWGIRDFEHRFRRKPEGMWLAETAVDNKTLEVLVKHEIKFVILAPHQAKCVRKKGEKIWDDVQGAKINPLKPYLCKLPSGAEINIFFYDGPISQEIAFGDLLKNGINLAKRLAGVFPLEDDEPRLAHIATDGETYGHHQHHGDMALTYCYFHIEENNLAKITVYGEFLEKFPPTHEVEIVENSSWSCCHGIERWRSDCGCNSGGKGDWHQKWREPLRASLDVLRNEASFIFEKELKGIIDNPWKLRNEYIEVILNRSVENVEYFLENRVAKDLSKENKIKVLSLLEAQRHAMFMYTSCGWFFDDVSGIETVQIIQYAARVIQLTKEVSGIDLEEKFVKMLQKVPGNHPEYLNGAIVYEKCVKPAMTDLLRVGVHYAISSLFQDYEDQTNVFCYTINRDSFDTQESGKHKIVSGITKIRSDVTWNEDVINFTALHLGDHNISAGVSFHTDDNEFENKRRAIYDAFNKRDITKTMQLIEKSFDTGHYSLWHLFKDEQSTILYKILSSTLEEVESSLRKINEYHSPIIQVIKQLHIPLPKVLSNTIVVMLNADLLQTIGRDIINFEKLEQLVLEAKEWSLELDKTTIGFIVLKKINRLVEGLVTKPESLKIIETAAALLKVLEPLDLKPDLWKAQNTYFSIASKQYAKIKIKADSGDKKAEEWVKHFDLLGNHLKVKTP
ncbi:MAG: DUF3536 domain-containing protein [Candidatus Zapsychrus exili]|nr:DUF3536 domain-containing protein [Candidatus Zapsychrus exili]